MGETAQTTAESQPDTTAVPSLREMLSRTLKGQSRSRSARTVELFGWLDLMLGLSIFLGPHFVAQLLNLPPLSAQTANYVRVVGLLVSGLGTLYIVSGRLNARGFIFASLVDRPAVPVVMSILWWFGIAPAPLALAFSISDFGGFLWTLRAWRAETRYGEANAPSLIAQIAATFFGFVSGVIRNSRTFHPDGRVFRGSTRALSPADPTLKAAAEHLNDSTALLRIGMGVMKRGMPVWLAKLIPDAPSIAVRFRRDDGRDPMSVQRVPDADLDLLCTAGGDRLWKLVLNLMLGGKMNGLHPFDYFRNEYYTETPYRVDGGTAVWLRLAVDSGSSYLANPSRSRPVDPASREADLTNATLAGVKLRVEAQLVGDPDSPFIPLAEIQFEEEIQVDQEALHFDPVAGRGFAPYGMLTEVRKSVYPASVHSRAASVNERVRRDGESWFARWARYLHQSASIPLADGISTMGTINSTTHADSSAGKILKWAKNISLIFAGLLLVFGIYMAIRLSSDRVKDDPSDLVHFKHGSTGGERTMGIPYWFWVALPEIFSDYLPDKQRGRGYSSFGMIYENDEDPRYALPVGVSHRYFRGIDVVYLNCAVCHTGTVRKTAADKPTVVAGMPANTVDLGAFEKFLTSIALDEKFTAPQIMAQIDAMQDHPNSLVERPDFINRLIFQFYAVPLMREKMLMLGQRLGFIDASTWGPGRVDTFNAPKALLNFNMTNADPSELMGNADFPSVWNQGPRKGLWLHWDGNNNSVNERNLSAAFGTGANPRTLDSERVLRTAKWLETAQPLEYKTLYPVDQALADRGAPVYQEYCQSCHGSRQAPYRISSQPPNEGVGTVVDIDKIGTDRARLDSYTYLVAETQSTLYAGYEREWGFNQDYPKRFSSFRKTNGYANMPLDGIWLRAPYLHNGSVPNLRELLEAPEKRTKKFYRGNDVYDPKNVGFVSDVPSQDGRRFFLIDTDPKPPDHPDPRFQGRPHGNGNGGHNYGTSLSTEQKEALLEYLKTF